MVHVLIGALLTAQALTFAEALEQAAKSPVVRAEQQAQDQRAAMGQRMSRLTSNPLVYVQPGGRDLRYGGSGPEIYVGVAQRVNLAGLGKKRAQAVDRELEHDASLIELTHRRVRYEVAQTWLTRWTAQQAKLVTAAEVELARELEQRIAATFTAGEATRVDLAIARAYRAEAQVLELAAEGEAFDAGVALARAMGIESERPLAVALELPKVDLPAEANMQAQWNDVAQTAQVAESRAERVAEHARLVELRAARGPHMAVGALGWREGGGDVAAVATIEVEIPAFERGERERATAEAQLARAAGREQATTVAMRAERVTLLHDVEHTREVMNLVEKEVLVASEDLADAQRKRLEAREATAQDWVIARRAVLKAKLDLVRARAAHVLARFLAAESWRTGTTRRPQ